MKINKKYWEGHHPKQILIFLSGGGGQQNFEGSTNVGYKKLFGQQFGGGQQNFEKHIFVGQTFQGVHNFGDFWGVPKMNVVRALWVSEEPLWYTQYSERDLEP